MYIFSALYSYACLVCNKVFIALLSNCYTILFYCRTHTSTYILVRKRAVVVVVVNWREAFCLPTLEKLNMYLPYIFGFHETLFSEGMKTAFASFNIKTHSQTHTHQTRIKLYNLFLFFLLHITHSPSVVLFGDDGVGDDDDDRIQY